MGKLTIQEVAKVLVDKGGLNQRDANAFAVELFNVIMQRLQQGESVKVKGLGTFKIIAVEARESVSVRTGERVLIDSHPKVSFTPDTTMKELVNRPFSQFETVILNDGVDFADLKSQNDVLFDADIQTEEQEEEEMALLNDEYPVEKRADSALAPEEPVALESPIDIEEKQGESETGALLEFAPEEQTVKESLCEEESITKDSVYEEELDENCPEENEVTEGESLTEEMENELSDEEGSSRSHSWGWWLVGIIIVLGLMALSALGGYQYARVYQPVVVIDTVEVRDTVYMADCLDTLGTNELETSGAFSDNESAEDAVLEESPISKEKQQPAPVADTDQYAQKDERVRLGAYRIVGLDHEVTVLAGQTFYSICRAHLGPEMECYVEVYNDLPRNPQIKAGQIIRIPKLELKKRHKSSK